MRRDENAIEAIAAALRETMERYEETGAVTIDVERLVLDVNENVLAEAAYDAAVEAGMKPPTED